MVVASLVAALLSTPLAGLGQEGPKISLHPESGPAGSDFTVKGTGFLRFIPVEIRWAATGGEIVGQVDGEDVGADGTFETVATVPSDAMIAPNRVFACQQTAADPCAGLPGSVFTVTEPPPTTTTTRPPPTTTTTTSPATTTTQEATTTTAGETTTTLGLTATSTTLGPDPVPTSLPDFSVITTTSTFPIQDPGPDFPDLIATDIEVTQGSQNLDSTMPLVANRSTWVRVHMRTNGAELNGVKALLRIEKDGQEVIVEPDYPWPKRAVADGGDRTMHVHNFSFLIPNQWTDTGQTKFTAYVYWNNPLTPYQLEPTAQNNYSTHTARFRTGRDAVIYLIRLSPGDDQPVVTWEENKDAPSWMGPQLMARHPIAEAVFYPVFGPLGPDGDAWDLDESPGEALDRLAWLRAYWDIPLQEWLMGYVHPGAVDKWAGFARSGSEVGFTIKNYDTMAHESGHITGLKHVACQDEKLPLGEPDELLGGAIDPTHPNAFPDCQYSDGDPEGFMGANAYGVGSAHPTIYPNDPSDPDHRWPLMGYKDDRWTDPYHYCSLLNYYGVPCDHSEIGVPGKFIPPTEPVDCTPEESGPYILELCFTNDDPSVPYAVIPEIDDLVLIFNANADGEIETAVASNPGDYLAWKRDTYVQEVVEDRVGKFREPTKHPARDDPDQIGSFNYRVEISGGGATLLSLPLISRDSDAEGILPRFFEVLPYPEGAEQIDLLRDGVVIGTKPVSPSQPQVTVLTPNGGEEVGESLEITWEASDADDDELSYTVLYSADGGDTYQPIVVGYPTNSLVVTDLDDLTGSEEGVVKVVASDGVNTGSDTSDGVFSVPGGPPTAIILGPENGGTYPLGGKVPFHGVASDREDGTFSDTLTWSSDLDGMLGAGPRFTIADLTPGVHEITLQASDSDGEKSSSSVHIKIDDSVVIPGPDEETLELGETVFARFDSGDFTPIAPEDEADAAGTGFPLWIAIALGVVAVAGVGYGIRARSTESPE